MPSSSSPLELNAQGLILSCGWFEWAYRWVGVDLGVHLVRFLHPLRCTDSFLH